MDNLIDLVGQHITPDILQKASALTGESEAATQSAMSAMLPTLVGAFANKGANEVGAKKVMDWVGAQGDSDQFINGFSGMLDNPESSNWVMDTGGALIGWLMGSKADDGASMISSMAGIGGGSSSTLMKMIAPLALAVIGKKALGSGMGAGGIASMFLGQKSFLQSAAPAGLLGLLGLNSFDELGKSATSFATTTTTTTTTTSAGGVATQGAVTQGTVTQGTVTQSTAQQGISAGTVAAGTAAAGAAASAASYQAATSGVSTPSVSTPSVSTPSVSTPDVSMPSVSTPDVNIARPSARVADAKLPDVDMPKASVSTETIVEEKSRFTKVETDKRDYAYTSGRPEASVDTGSRTTSSSATSSSAASRTASSQSATYDQKAKAVVTDTVTEVVEEERPLFNKVWSDKRDIEWGNFFGRWFGWTIVTGAICAGLLFWLGMLEPFLGMFMGQ